MNIPLYPWFVFRMFSFQGNGFLLEALTPGLHLLEELEPDTFYPNGQYSQSTKNIGFFPVAHSLLESVITGIFYMVS